MSLDFDYHELSGALNACGDRHDYWIDDHNGIYELSQVGTRFHNGARSMGQFVSIIDAIEAANKDNEA
jgi:hypothetical protein